MVNICKKYFNEKLKEKSWKRLQKKLFKARTEKEFEKTLNGFLTPSEMVMLEKRLAILELLEQGFKYRDISEMIDVSDTTITFIKRGFKKNPKKARTNKKENKSSEIFELPDIGFPTYKSKGRWRYLNR